MSLNNYNFKIYPIHNFTDGNIKIKFGFELETCILASCIYDDKTTYDTLVKIINENNTMDKNKERQSILLWSSLIHLFVINNIVNPEDNEFIKEFPVSYIVLEPKSGVSDFKIDMKTGSIEEVSEPIYYDSLIFTRDSSVQCTDTNIEKYFCINNKREKDEFLRTEATIHCEIISPILNNVSKATILFDRLYKSNCFRENKSAGFHINISVVNDKDKPLYYSNGMIDSLLDYYEPYENQNYQKFSSKEKIKYANSIINYSKNYTYRYYSQFFNKSYLNKEIERNFTSGIKFYRSFVNLDFKYLAIHTKNDYILEFRLFPTSEDSEQLFKYILNTIDIIYASSENYIKNYKKIIDNLQSLNLKIEMDYSEPDKYTGPLYNSINDDREMVKIENDEDLELSLHDFFNARGFDIEKIIPSKDNNFVIIARRKINTIVEEFELDDLDEDEKIKFLCKIDKKRKYNVKITRIED